MGGGGNGNFSNGQFGGLPLGGGGGQGTVPGRPPMSGGGGFGQQPPMMGNRPVYTAPFPGMPPMPSQAPQTGGLQPPQSTASPYGGPASRVPLQQQTGGGLPPGVSMGFSPQGTPGQNPSQMGMMPPRVPPMSAPGDYGSDFLMRALRGG